MIWIFGAIFFWIIFWVNNIQLSKIESNKFIKLLVPTLFGFSILILWEGFVRGFDVSPILLPTPTAIAIRFSQSLNILWVDFVQTFINLDLPSFIGLQIRICHRCRITYTCLDLPSPIGLQNGICRRRLVA